MAMGRWCLFWAIGLVGAMFSTPRALADSSITLCVNGVYRSFVLHVPASYVASRKYALMLAANGKNGTGSQMAHTTGFDRLGDTYGFFTAYPNPLDGNWVYGGPDDDIAFSTAIIAWMEENYSIDPTRLYYSGLAEGGRLAVSYVCTEAPGYRLAGLAIVADDMNQTDAAICNDTPQPPLPFLIFHGTSDNASPYGGGKSGAGTVNLSAAATAQYWATNDDCPAASLTSLIPDELSNGEYVTDQAQFWTACQFNTGVTFYTITEGGHNWPGSVHAVKLPVARTGPVSLDIDASLIIWQTLSAFTLPPEDLGWGRLQRNRI